MIVISHLHKILSMVRLNNLGLIEPSVRHG